MLRSVAAALVFVLAASRGFAVDVYALQGRASGPPFLDCLVLHWDGDLLFHNRGDESATIALQDISNGGAISTARREFTLPPHRSTSLDIEDAHWEPANGTTLWVVHLSAPPSVAIESRIEVGVDSTCPLGTPMPLRGVRGKLSFPSYTALEAANVAAVHLGTDLALINSRNNVAVYNAGAVAANVVIEVRQLCDDAIVTARGVAIPANTVIQVSGLSTTTACTVDVAYGYMTYVRVIADQPSLSWVSSVANTNDISVVYGVTGAAR